MVHTDGKLPGDGRDIKTMGWVMTLGKVKMELSDGFGRHTHEPDFRGELAGRNSSSFTSTDIGSLETGLRRLWKKGL